MKFLMQFGKIFSRRVVNINIVISDILNLGKVKKMPLTVRFYFFCVAE